MIKRNFINLSFICLFLTSCGSNSYFDVVSSVEVTPAMIRVDGGTFEMGSTDGGGDEKPVHSVTLSSFEIGKYEVTQKEFEELMGFNPSYSSKLYYSPVENVSWFDAIRFCNARSKKEGIAVAYNEESGDLLDQAGNVTTDITQVKGYRLPTEAEWEYAARGGNKSGGFKYAGSDDPDEVAWYSGNSNKTHNVGLKKANELGIHDMSGNVWEWTTDWYQDYKDGSITNPYISEKSSYRVRRGGSWHYSADYLRVAGRNYNTPSDSDYNLGFRLARSN